MSENRPPRGREKNVTGQGKDVYKRGEGLGTGPVGNQQGYSGRPGKGSSSGSKKGLTRAGGGLGLLALAMAAVLGGNGLFGGDTTTPTQTQQPTQQTQQYTQQTNQPQQGAASLSSLLSGFAGSGVSQGWQNTANVSSGLDTTVASGSRAKRTQIVGNGADVVTIMVYMCGTDLESRNSMATSDLQEMAGATVADNINLIVFTGGCKSWRNNVVSSSVNQIYQIKNGGLICLAENAGTAAMTDPDNLSAFIKWCGQNFPANRNELIFWDHGGGSLTGYGYDEKNSRAGSMTIGQIGKALKDGGVTFDFIGFDTCLMATVETALTIAPYADYMVASEETEPGVGWYYTNWLSQLSKNTSTPTLEIGKNIVDDFVSVCAQKCRGQSTTLSVVDLAELEHTVPQELKDFAAGTSKLLQNSQYNVVSNARASSREFASSSRIDQVDLVHLASNMGTQEGKDLANALLGAIKYNRTSANMTNSYGLSIYFPYKKTSSVQTAVNTYQAIGMDEDYTRVIQQFASMGVAGQAVSGGATSPLTSLLGGSYGSAATPDDMIGQLLGSLLSGSLNGVSGLTSSNSGFLGRSLNVDEATQFITDNRFDANALVWVNGSDGKPAITLSEDQWALVQDLKLNLFMDDGEGYIDMGMDNVYDIEGGSLSGEYDGTWLAINEQPVAYYHMHTTDDGESYTITGRVPVLINDVRADLILVFDDENPHGYIAGARYDYRDGETETVAKAVDALEEGDRLDFVCDYYSYDGEYLDSYMLGDSMTVEGELKISDVYIDRDMASATYRFTDIYQQEYWTPEMP